MNGATINHILSTDPYTQQYLQGFAFRNTPINIRSFPSLFILNTDLNTGHGEHWCVAFFPNASICEYFDPFGHPPTIPGIYSFSEEIFRNINESIIYNTKPVQNLLQSTCGHHCIYFSVLRCRNIPMNTILTNHYTDSTTENDYRAFKYTQTLGNKYAEFIDPISTFHKV
jgi:hypothetical protein